MGKKLPDRNVVLLKEEATEGVDPTPTASANAIAIMEPVVPEYDANIIERVNPLDGLSGLSPLIGEHSTKFSISTPFYGGGAVDTPPRIGDLLEACGFLETINASTSVVYTPASSSLKTGFEYIYVDGLLYKVAGSVGNLKIAGKLGEPVIFSSDMQGVYQADADSSIVTPQFGSNFNSQPQSMGITFSLDSVTTFLLREFNIDMGQPIIKRTDMKAATGVAGFMLGKRKPTGNLIIEAESKATYDFLAKWKANTQVAASIVIGSTTGNKLTIALNLNYTNIQIEDGDGTLVLNIPIALGKATDAGNDEITLTCT